MSIQIDDIEVQPWLARWSWRCPVRRRTPILLALLGVLAVTGCSSSGGQSAQSAPAITAATSAATSAGAPAAGGGKFAVITHGAAGDSFWDVVKNGAEAAGEQYGVT